jgi:hypothetical protein
MSRSGRPAVLLGILAALTVCAPAIGRAQDTGTQDAVPRDAVTQDPAAPQNTPTQGTPQDPTTANTPDATPTAAAGQGTATAAGTSGQGDVVPPDGFRMGDFVFKPGGRVKLDVIRDFDPVGNEDSFDTRTIRVDETEGTNSNIHAKETRLSLDIRGPWQDRELRMYIETDFYGTSSALRLRHAYGTWGGLLAGQTWSTFMDDENFPRTIDFESPTAFAMVRQAQARWTQKLGGFTTWSVAVEDNKSNIIVPEDLATIGKAEYPSPDFVTRFRFGVPNGHITTSGFVGAAGYRPFRDETVDTDRDTELLWGTMVSALFSTWGRDTIYGVGTIGEGIGRYRGGVAAVFDQNNKLHAVGGVAFMGGYEHFWSDKWSTNAVYSIADADSEPFYTSALNKELQYGAANLLFWFLGDRGWTGVEYLYGHRDVFGGASGAAHRVQYAVRFNLP